MKRKWNFSSGESIIKIVLIVLLSIQILFLCYLNLFQLENHVGYDSSWNFYRTVLMADENTINSANWAETTSYLIDSSSIIACLLYKVTGNIYLSFGIANILILCLIIYILYEILNKLNVNGLVKILIFNLFLCPFMTNDFFLGNDLGYFSSVLSGAAFYNVRILIMLLAIYSIIHLEANNKVALTEFLSIVLFGISSFSTGVFLSMVFLIPCFIYYFYNWILGKINKLTVVHKYIFACLISSFIGYIMSVVFSGGTINEVTKTWTTAENFWINIGLVFQGLIKLLGVLPLNKQVDILSCDGIIYMATISIFVSFIVSFVCSYKNKSINCGVVNILIFIVGFNIITFSLFNVQYGAVIYEERYLIPIFVLLLIIFAVCLSEISNFRIYIATCVILFFSIAAVDVYSGINYIKTTNEYWQEDEIVEIVKDENADLIYVWGDEVNLCGRIMQVKDLQHHYKTINTDGTFHHCGFTYDFEDNSEYEGATMLLLFNNTSYVPESIMNQYELVKQLDWVSLYKCDYNPVDLTNGITGDISVDYPTTPGMMIANSQIEGNSIISDGTEGFVLYGPYCDSIEGIYDITLYYEILEGDFALFNVSQDYGIINSGVMELSTNANECNICDIKLENGHKLEYRVWCNNGTRVRIDKIVISKK